MSRPHWTAALALTAALLPALGAASRAANSGGGATAGKAAYLAKGCYECHGTTGRGALPTGPAIAPLRLSPTAFAAYVRAPAGVMPPYRAAILSDADLQAIGAYLRAVPAPRPAAAIPLLARYAAPFAPIRSAAASDAASPGRAIYLGHCAVCHGPELGGGVGPALDHFGATGTLEETVAFIKAPPPPMPHLYPKPLDEQQVRAVAAYIRKSG